MRVEGRLLVVTRLDLECGRQRKVGIDSRRVLNGGSESILEGRLFVARIPVPGPFTECTVAI